MFVNAPVICNHLDHPPTGNSGDFDFSSSKFLLETIGKTYAIWPRTAVLFLSTLLCAKTKSRSNPALLGWWKGTNPAHLPRYPWPSPVVTNDWCIIVHSLYYMRLCLFLSWSVSDMSASWSNPNMQKGLIHPYMFDGSISIFRGIWYTFFILFIFDRNSCEQTV